MGDEQKEAVVTKLVWEKFRFLSLPTFAFTLSLAVPTSGHIPSERPLCVPAAAPKSVVQSVHSTGHGGLS